MAKKQSTSDDHGLPSLSLVFGYIAIKDLQRLEDRVTVLSRLGYGANEIAAICDTSPATVFTLRSVAKKSKLSRRAK
jgi:hypothetical protein